MLRDDPRELDLLAKDLLINVTCFFRDPKVFDFLGEKRLPDLIARSAGGAAPAHLDRRMQHRRGNLFAGHAVSRGDGRRRQGDQAADFRLGYRWRRRGAGARRALSGVHRAEVSAERLARFFVKEERGYRVVPDLRADVVFTVQDVLADPPFSRLDFVSCRNLLIYLGPEAQAKVMDMFHFALREGGMLLLGGAETVGETHGRFTAISKTERVFRHTARGRPGDFGFPGGDGARVPRAIGRANLAVAPEKSRRTVPAPGAGKLRARRGADQSQQ